MNKPADVPRLLDMKRLLTLSSIGLAIIVALFGAFVAHDSRYAQAADVDAIKNEVKSLRKDMKIDQLENRQSILRQYKFAFENEKLKRSLTTLEDSRLREVTGELDHVTEALSNLTKGHP